MIYIIIRKNPVRGDGLIKQKVLSVRDICFIGLFAALIAVLAQISIPMPYGVPMTLQTFAVPLAGLVLGARKGALAATVYVLLGAMGVPVFAGFTGGLGRVLGTTGGFILSFPAMAYAVGIGVEKGKSTALAFWLTVGFALNHLCGLLMFRFVMSADFYTAFTACVLPFLPTTFIKMILLGTLGVRLKKATARARVAL